MYKLSLFDKISIILVIIGALNWGILGIANLNVVEKILSIFGSASTIIETIVYILVGVAGLNLILLIYRSKSKKSS